MFRKILNISISISLLLLLVVFTSSCNDENENSIQFSSIATESELITDQNYKINEEIEIGESKNIIEKKGVIKSNVSLNGMLILGVNKQDDSLLYYEPHSKSIITFKMDTGEVIDNWDILKDRKNKIYAINKTGDIIAWAECPCGNIDPNTDRTKGAGWEVYYADVTTREIKKVDEDSGIILPNQHIEYGYLAPSKLAISDNYISYITFDYNLENQITAVIKLYDIKTEKLEIIDYLNEDLSYHAFGYPNISGDKMVWCKALVKPDGTYDGECYYYDINKKEKAKLITDENIINPTISGNFICVEGKPGKTFYDGEVCIYNIKDNKWEYKINGQFEQYNKMANIYLNYLTATDKYLLWETAIQRALIIFNFYDQKLYKIVNFEEGHEVRPVLVQDNVLIYGLSPFCSNIDNTWYYIYLQ